MKNLKLSFNPESMAIDLMDFLIDKATDNDGNLVKAVDLSSGKVVDPKPNDDELGDYVQSFVWLGKHLGLPKYLQWGINHVIASLKKFFIMINKGRIWVVPEADRIIGPVHVLLITKKNEIAKYIDDYFSLLFRLAVARNGLLWNKTNNRFFLKSPVADPMVTGNHIELLCQLYLHFNKKYYFDLAHRLIIPWLSDRNFFSYGIYIRRPIGVGGIISNFLKDTLHKCPVLGQHVGGHPSYVARITKQNTHMLFGLLRFYQITKRVDVKIMINRFFETVLNQMKHSSGLYYHAFDIKLKQAFHLDILSCISLIELAIDTYKEFGDSSYLSIAEDAANALLQFKDRRGLIPQCPVPKEVNNRLARLYYSGMPVNYLFNLDPQVDFFVNLIKLYDCTNDQFILESATKLAESIIHYFKFGQGFAEILLDKQPCNVVRTKYLGLLLKLFIAIIGLKNDISILNNSDLALVCQDR